MTLSPQGTFRRMEVLPISLTKDGVPHLAEGEMGNSILDSVKKRSETLGTTINRESWYSVVDLPKAGAAR